MRILRINTRTRTFAFESASPLGGLGGRALTARIIATEVVPDSHPLSAANRLVLAAGILSGTSAASSGRISVGAKSPLTGGMKESNAGGQFARHMARLGLRAIIIEDKPESPAAPCILHISAHSVEFRDAAELSGLRSYAAQERLCALYGPHAVSALIGPAGEQCLKAATIQFSDSDGLPSRAAGCGGMGAVMGSKGIKAIVLNDDGDEHAPVADPEAFRAARREWAGILHDQPAPDAASPSFGTAALADLLGLSNHEEPRHRIEPFEGASRICGETLAEAIDAHGASTRRGCHSGCVIQCSRIFTDANGAFVTSGHPHETIWRFGADLLIGDLDIVARMDRACDELGLDSLEMARTLAIAMEAGLIMWGDGPAALRMLLRVDADEQLGRMLGNGAAFAAAAFGVTRLPSLDTLRIAKGDPRAAKKRERIHPAAGPASTDTTVASIASDDTLGHDPHIATAAADSLGLCIFVAFAVMRDPRGLPCMARMLTALTGSEWTEERLKALGADCLSDERNFNERAGADAGAATDAHHHSVATDGTPWRKNQ
ncbi:aldehyde:ferredoxin oxidoreductase [Desulfobaculum xiamenense]|uniref:Aldehyde:ferredoxin oxidoreductase n=1 Tax=Desulfobaculum xiamenense TaxID=995050 RepID=A0A846QLU2_9BACT|nr:aldehyde ferredoxin oxidoreductase N-terminal domain-containing protein [Desulfobaculum xiamenense]NJB69071.1 aldehyde:ferredoxin oxidoreductase [Desulfobaculum xiamenense]